MNGASMGEFNAAFLPSKADYYSSERVVNIIRNDQWCG